MRYLCSLLFLLLPAVGAAQQKPVWRMGFSTGIICNQSNFDGADMLTVSYNSENINVWLGMKLRAEFKHIVVGAALETGLIDEHIGYDLEQYFNGRYAHSVAIHERKRIFSPAFMPVVFAHYKLMLPRNAFLYAGPAVGVLTGYNEFRSNNMTVATGGIDAGISLKMNDKVRFEVAHAWRTARVNMGDGIFYEVPPDNAGNYVQYRIPNFWLQSITNSIALAITL